MKNERFQKTVLLSVMALAIAPYQTMATSVGSISSDINNNTIVGEDEWQQKISEYTTYNSKLTDSVANVYASSESTYSIVIPKTIILDGGTNTANTGEYTVSVIGDLTGTQTINIVPETNQTNVYGGGASLDGTKTQFYLGQSGKDDIVATVEQSKTSWSWDEVMDGSNVVGIGLVSVDNLSAGEWGGYFNFNVSIDASHKAISKVSYTIEFNLNVTNVKIEAIDTKNNSYLGVTNPNGTSVTFNDLTPNETYTLQISGDSTNFGSTLQSFRTNSVDEKVTVTPLTDWNYIKTTYNGEEVIKLSKYIGSSENVLVPSTMLLNGVEYPVVFAKSGYTGEEVNVNKYGDEYYHAIGMYGPFAGNTSIKTVTFADGSVVENNAMDAMFYGCTSLVSVSNIPEGVKSLKFTFGDCKSLVIAPEIPSTVTNMYCTFKYCSSLRDLSNFKIPDGVTNFCETFHSCISLTAEDLDDLIIPNSVTGMDYTFKNCQSLIRVPNFTLPNSLKTVYEIFYDCDNLVRVDNFVIPSSVTDIRRMFYGLANLQGNIILNGSPSLYAGAFNSVTSTLTVDYTSKCTNIAKILSGTSVTKGSLVDIAN